MLDQQDLQAIGQMMSAMMAEQEDRLTTKMATMISEQETRFDAKIAEQEERLTAKISEQEERLTAKISEQEERLTAKIAEQKQETLDGMKVLIEAEVMPKFNLLADQIALLRETLAPSAVLMDVEEDVSHLQDRVTVLEADVAQLKKAQ